MIWDEVLFLDRLFEHALSDQICLDIIIKILNRSVPKSDNIKHENKAVNWAFYSIIDAVPVALINEQMKCLVIEFALINQCLVLEVIL